MKIYKYLLMLPLALMAASCSDENKEALAEEEGTNQLKSVYANKNKISLWNPGETITYITVTKSCPVRHLDDVVSKCAEEIMDYANINFEEVYDVEDAQVVFEFEGAMGDCLSGLRDMGCNYTSCVGKGSFKNGKTIHISDTEWKSKDQLKHLILHGFGHVLGLQDEIFNKNFNLVLNTTQMSKDMIPSSMIGYALTRAEYDSYMAKFDYYYEREGASAVAQNYYSGEFDPSSVMMCEINKKYIWAWGNRKSSEITDINASSQLSTGDKIALMKLYPFTGDIVPIYAGSDKETSGIIGSEGVIGKFEDFADKSKIRKKIGYGYKTQKAGTLPVYRFTRKVNNKVVEVRYSWVRNGAYTNGIDSRFEKASSPVAFIYDNVGYGKTPIEVYYGNTTRSYSGVSFCNDPYMKSRGNYAPGFWATVLTQIP